jgi:hypothetical protein
VVEAGQFLLVVIAVIENMRVMKILMDEGSGINILYKDAFNKLNMDIRKLHASQSPSTASSLDGASCPWVR